MTEAHNELGRVSSLRADAVGEPGSRRFRLLVESRNAGSATLWMEKEQLFNLCEAVKRIIAIVEEQTRSGGLEPTEEAGTPLGDTGSPLEIQTSRLAIGYDERTALFIIAAHTEDESEDTTAMVSLMATQQQVDALADQGFEVCAAGRPRCILCGAPMGRDSHVCPRHNGNVMPEA